MSHDATLFPLYLSVTANLYLLCDLFLLLFPIVRSATSAAHIAHVVKYQGKQ